MVIIVGESASGKSSVMQELVESFGYERVLEYTTRPPREGENSGVDCHFISEEEFRQLLDQNYFITYTCFEGWYYGIAFKDCMYSNSNHKVLVTNPSALRQIKKASLKNPTILFRSVYLKIPRRDRLIKILQRGDDVDESYRRNLSDVGQFHGIENEVDYVVENVDYKFSIHDIANKVHELVGGVVHED